jgi:CRP-like cAMP-binding protein
MLAGCVPVQLNFGQVLAERGESISHVYFPSDSFISLVMPIGATSLEVALVGSEGMLGLPIALGVGLYQLRAVVQGAGAAMRMTVPRFRQELVRGAPLRRALNRYALVRMSQLAQGAACNRFHLVESRLARWLLMSSDRARSPKFPITHQLLAFMLGVRRVGITRAASALQSRGLISYVRGKLTILDRAGLERASCRCYQDDLDAYAKMFGLEAAR